MSLPRNVILLGDVRARLAELPDECVHCVVTLDRNAQMLGLLVELERTKLTKEHVCLFCKLRWHRREMRHASMDTRRRISGPESLQFQTDFDLSMLALNVWQSCAKESNSFLLDYTKTIVRKSAALRCNCQHFRRGQQGVDEFNGLAVCHGKFKPNDECRRSALGRSIPLNSDVTFSVDHPSEIAQLPFREVAKCVVGVHTQ